MFKNKKVLLGIVFAFIALALLVAFFIGEFFLGKPREKLDYSRDIKEIQEENKGDHQKEIAENSGDLVMGEKSAPITIVAYDSFSCPHCAFFYINIYPEIKTKYIDTGKVKFIHRDFPLDLQSLTATKLLKCFHSNNSAEQTFKVIKAVFEFQGDWTKSNVYSEDLSRLFEMGGMKASEATDCLADEELDNRILDERLRTAKILKVSGTPTFFINGEKMEKEQSFENFANRIEELSK